MSKNKFKKQIQDRYKGRGNTWVKVEFKSKAYEYVEEILNNVKEEVKSQFIEHNKREGFSWMRYKKVVGDENNPITIFEVRIKGSKIDQPEYEVNIPDQFVSELELLGNTPVKLQLETENKVFKQKTVVNKKTKVVNDYIPEVDIENEIKIIKEAALKKSSDSELKEWYKFLKANNIYEESAWQ